MGGQVVSGRLTDGKHNLRAGKSLNVRRVDMTLQGVSHGQVQRDQVVAGHRGRHSVRIGHQVGLGCVKEPRAQLVEGVVQVERRPRVRDVGDSPSRPPERMGGEAGWDALTGGRKQLRALIQGANARKGADQLACRDADAACGVATCQGRGVEEHLHRRKPIASSRSAI